MGLSYGPIGDLGYRVSWDYLIQFAKCPIAFPIKPGALKDNVIGSTGRRVDDNNSTKRQQRYRWWLSTVEFQLLIACSEVLFPYINPTFLTVRRLHPKHSPQSDPPCINICINRIQHHRRQ